MALQLRRALLRSSSIPNCSSISPNIPSDSSHLINLSKTLFTAAFRHENPSIRQSPSSTSPNRFLFGSHCYRQYATKRQKAKIDLPKFPQQPSQDEMIQTCFQNLTKVLESVEDAKAFKEVSEKLRNSCLEMIELLKGLEMIEQLKGLLGLVSVSSDSDIDNMNNKYEDNIENAKGESGSPRYFLGIIEKLFRYKDYVEMIETTDVQKKSNFKFSPEETAVFEMMLKDFKETRGSAVPIVNNSIIKPRPQAIDGIIIRRRSTGRSTDNLQIPDATY